MLLGRALMLVCGSAPVLLATLALGCGPSETYVTTDARSADASGRSDATGADAAPADATPADATPADATPADAEPGDLTAPRVLSTTPANADTAVAPNTSVSIVFSEPMNPSTITTNSVDLSCSGSLQISLDGFSTCLQMTTAPLSADNTIFEITPAAGLSSATPYRIRVQSTAQDAAGNAMVAPFDTAEGFTARYFHSIAIDAMNDFLPASESLPSSTTGGQILVSYDSSTLYLALTHADIQASNTGIGNKFVYFLFSTDSALATGNPGSSDSKAQFGTAGTKSMMYHWKSRIDGVNFDEFRRGDNAGWDADWGTTGKVVHRSAGLLEASIALSEFGGSTPLALIISTYTVDYQGDDGNGWVYNMLAGATDGTGLTPRALIGYLELLLPSSSVPNDAAHLGSF